MYLSFAFYTVFTKHIKCMNLNKRVIIFYILYPYNFDTLHLVCTFIYTLYACIWTSFYIDLYKDIHVAY